MQLLQVILSTLADTSKVQSRIEEDIAVSIGSCTQLHYLGLPCVSDFTEASMSQLTGLTSEFSLLYVVKGPVLRIACSSAG